MPINKIFLQPHSCVRFDSDFTPGTHVQSILMRFHFLVIRGRIRKSELGEYVMLTDPDGKWMTWAYLSTLKIINRR